MSTVGNLVQVRFLNLILALILIDHNRGYSRWLMLLLIFLHIKDRRRILVLWGGIFG
jgi:hypothetical protein